MRNNLAGLIILTLISAGFWVNAAISILAGTRCSPVLLHGDNSLRYLAKMRAVISVPGACHFCGLIKRGLACARISRSDRRPSRTHLSPSLSLSLSSTCSRNPRHTHSRERGSGRKLQDSREETETHAANKNRARGGDIGVCAMRFPLSVRARIDNEARDTIASLKRNTNSASRGYTPPSRRLASPLVQPVPLHRAHPLCSTIQPRHKWSSHGRARAHVRIIFFYERFLPFPRRGWGGVEKVF